MRVSLLSAALLLLLCGAAAATAVQKQWFLAGGCVSWPSREKLLPGRVFLGFNGAEQDPIDVMMQANWNAYRFVTYLTDTYGPCDTTVNNDGYYIDRELNYLLDYCVDLQVQTAKTVKIAGFKVILTINMGIEIPVAWQSYTYKQMLAAVATETKRQVGWFVDAGVQPDIILLENEGSYGLLYNINGTFRGKTTTQICGTKPIGTTDSWPLLAGYYKQMILSSREAIASAGFDSNLTRFGLHSHAQYVDWKNTVVYPTDTTTETTLSGCDFSNIIPSNILKLSASDMLDIIGWSAYSDAMLGITSSAETTAFGRLKTTLATLNSTVARYGKYTSGPFTGQYKKQGLLVEFASNYTYPSGISAQQTHTKTLFAKLLAYKWMLGAMWWEPTYVYNNWMSGAATLYWKNWTWHYPYGKTFESPTATLTTWGSFASSPGWSACNLSLPSGATSWGTCASKVASGSSCKLNCSSGYNSVTGTCNGTNWLPKPSCSKDTAYCTLTSLPSGASGWGTCTTNVAGGSSCSLSCSNSATAIEGVCSEKGVWSTTPSCVTSSESSSIRAQVSESVIPLIIESSESATALTIESDSDTSTIFDDASVGERSSQLLAGSGLLLWLLSMF